MDKKLIIIIFILALIILAVTFGIDAIIIKLSEKNLKASSGKMELLCDYGVKFASEKKYDKAVKAFEKYLKHAPSKDKQELALITLAEIYENKNEYLKAQEAYKSVIEKFPNSKSIAKAQNSLERVNVKIMLSSIMTQDSIKYVVKANDTLGKIAKDHNVTVELLRKSNNITGDIIIPGKALKIVKGTFSIVVDKSQNCLILKKDGEIIKTYSVSTGANNSTPVGKFKIEEKLVNPPWYKMGAIVKPDNPDYELGNYWMGISEPGYGIHGTKDPSTIGKQATKGCIRMLNEDIEELYTIVPSGTEVEIVN